MRKGPLNLKPSGSWFRAMQTLSIRPLPREYTSTSQSWRNPLFVVLIPRYRPDVSGFLWHTAEAINWIKVYSPMQAGLFTTSALLPDIIKHNESPTVTSATIIRTRETWELFWGLTKQPTFRNATTHSVFPAKCRLKKERRNFILVTCHHPDLESASYWLKQIPSRDDRPEVLLRSGE